MPLLFPMLLATYCAQFYAGMMCIGLVRLHGRCQNQFGHSVKPKFFKPCSVPFTLRKKVEAELDRLQAMGVISPVKSSQWAALIVPVVKKDSRVRICGDFKVTTNKASPTESYPLPAIDDLMADLAGGKYFSLGLSNAYLQLSLDEKSSEFLTITLIKVFSDIIGCHLELHLLLSSSNGLWRHYYVVCMVYQITVTIF